MNNFENPVIVYCQYGHSGEGYYVYEDEYPEEGSIYFGETNEYLRI